MSSHDMKNAQGTETLSRKPVFLIALALTTAALILVGIILPAEFRIDPLGTGEKLGLTDLAKGKGNASAPVAQTTGSNAYRADGVFRTLTLTIPLKRGGDLERGDDVEYKVAMKPGQVILYSWSTAEGVDDQQFYSDFHGHLVTNDPDNLHAVSYQEGMGASGSGALTAQFDGVHGWYFQNQADDPATVKLTVTGFFDVVPAGQPGNEEGLIAQVRQGS